MGKPEPGTQRQRAEVSQCGGVAELLSSVSCSWELVSSAVSHSPSCSVLLLDRWGNKLENAASAATQAWLVSLHCQTATATASVCFTSLFTFFPAGPVNLI